MFCPGRLGGTAEDHAEEGLAGCGFGLMLVIKSTPVPPAPPPSTRGAKTFSKPQAIG